MSNIFIWFYWMTNTLDYKRNAGQKYCQIYIVALLTSPPAMELEY